MDNVIGVSRPRSGHHLLVRLLQLYFGDRFNYCNFYGGIEGCCKQLPCRRGDIHLTKSHDFDHQLPQLPDRKYLVQYRDFVPSVVSNYELYLLSNRAEPDTEEAFYRFASADFANYRVFQNKWVTSEFGQAQQLLNYEKLIEWPKESLRLAVQWIAPEVTPDATLIEDAVRKVGGQRVEKRNVKSLAEVGIYAKRDVTQFRHYKAGAFSRLAELKLTRPEVHQAFQEILGRTPNETNMLNLQGFEKVEDLQEFLLGSDEYRQRLDAQSTADREDRD